MARYFGVVFVIPNTIELQIPDGYENSGENDKHENIEENKETVNFSLIAGYGNNNTESSGYAVLDTGCSITVCGTEWLNSYVEQLSDFDKSNIKEIPLSATFTFGDRVTVQLMKKIALPCYLGSLRSEITADLFNCKILLLLSNRSMKRAKLILDFSNDTAQIIMY